MVACVASSSWAPHAHSTPLRPTSATWNTKFSADLSLSLSAASTSILYSSPSPAPKPRLRLPALATSTSTPVCRFDPFADDDEPPQMRPQENMPPTRGRPPPALTLSLPLGPSSPAPITGRRRAPSFSAGSGVRASSLPSLSLSPSPAPSLLRQSPATRVAAPHVPGAPSPFHARHYPTSDARSRLLARTLLNRIHAVGRPRSLYSCSSYSRTTSAANGYESESGARAYIPSRLSECVVAAC